MTLVPIVKAQLLAFLIYTTPALLQQQLQGAGQAPGQAQEGQEEEELSDLAQKLPGPCPVLRFLIAFDPSKASAHNGFWPSCLHASKYVWYAKGLYVRLFLTNNMQCFELCIAFVWVLSGLQLQLPFPVSANIHP